MIKNTLVVASILVFSSLSLVSYAEEPYIGVGIVNHSYEEEFGNANDFEAEPSSYRITLGSRIDRNWIMEAYYLETKDTDDEVLIGSRPTLMEVEYEVIVGASINLSYVQGPLRLYAGPNITAAKVKAITISPVDPVLDAINDKDTRLSPGLGVGIDIKPFRHFSINLNAQSYYFSDDILGTGVGAELRYHL